MKSSRFLMLPVFLAATFSLQADWVVENPSPAITVLRNDNGNFPGPQKGAVPIAGDTIHVRKIFDLKELSAETLKKARSARLKIYTVVYEYSTTKNPKLPSNGLSESIFVKINGKKKIVPTCDCGFYVKDSAKAPMHFRWTSIDFPVAWLNTPDEKLVVETGKEMSLTHDDYYYPAVDRSVKNTSSWASINSGKTWTRKWGNVTENGELMIRLELDQNPTTNQIEDCSEDFLSTPGACKFKNRGKTDVKNGILHFKGYPDSELIVPGGEKINITKNGLSMTCVIRFLDNLADAQKKNTDMMFFHKERSFFFGRTGSQFNFSLSCNKKRWSHALVVGEVPQNNHWVHLAAIAEYVNDTAQGNVGTRLSVYVNGELHAQRMFPYLYPDRNSMPILIGGGLSSYDLNGDIAEIGIYNQALNSSQIAALAANSPLVNLSHPGSYRLDDGLKQRFDDADKQAKTAFMRWFYNVLRRAVETGYPAKKADALLSGIRASTLDELKKTLEERNCGLALEISPEAAILFVVGKGEANYPVIGMLDRKLQQDVFDRRTIEWTIHYRDAIRKTYVMNSFDRSLNYTVTRNGIGNYMVVWRNGDFEIKSKIHFSGARLTWDFSADNPSRKFTVFSVNFPKLYLAKLPGDDILVFPHMSGILAKDPTKTFSMGQTFPSSRATMQFSGYFNGKNGRYFALEDPNARIKYCMVCGQNGALVSLWSQAVAYDPASPLGNPVRVTGKAALELYQGGWFEAGALYKKFLASEAKWWIRDIPRTSTPEWFLRNPLNLLIGSGNQETREALALREYFGLPYAVNWAGYWFDMKDPDFPQYVISTSGLQNMKELQAGGVRIKAYINPRLWEYRPTKPSTWRTSKGRNGAIVREDGSYVAEKYGAHDYAVLCPAAKLTADWNISAIINVVKLGFKGLYHDQLPCASPLLCYSTTHGHLHNDPSNWLENGYWRIYDELREKIRKIDPEIAHDGEEASDPYLSCLDGYMVWRWTDQNHVPLFQSVYAPRTQFTGRLFDFTGGGSYESFFAKLAEQMVCGEQLGWIHINNMRYASPRRLYLKKLAHLRYGLSDRFNRSDMMTPLVFRGNVPKLNTVWADLGGAHATETDKVPSSVWKDSKDGSLMVVLVNSVNEQVSIAPIWSYEDGTGTIFREKKPYRQSYDFRKNQDFKLTLEPYESVVIVSKPAGKEATEYAALLERIASFKDYGPILYHPQNFKACNKFKIEVGKTLAPVASSWRKNAFMPRGRCLAFDEDRWIQAVDKAEIFYGEADFGTENWKTVTMDLAAEAAEAGTKVQLLADGKILAEWNVTRTENWIHFKPFESRLNFVPAGKVRLSVQVNGKGCRIKNIRFLKDK